MPDTLSRPAILRRLSLSSLLILCNSFRIFFTHSCRVVECYAAGNHSVEGAFSCSGPQDEREEERSNCKWREQHLSTIGRGATPTHDHVVPGDVREFLIHRCVCMNRCRSEDVSRSVFSTD